MLGLVFCRNRAPEPPAPAAEAARLAAMRRQAPVRFLPEDGVWLVLGYDEARAALADAAVWSSRSHASIDPVLLGADPPAHGAARRLCARLFAAAGVERLGALAETEARVRLRPGIDLVGGFAGPLARSVARALLGLSAEDAAAIDGAAFAQLPGAPAGEVSDAVRRATAFALLREAGEAEAESLVRLMWRAAVDTTSALVARTALTLIERPELAARVAADCERLAPPLLEEVARLFPPQPTHIRLAAAPARLGSAEIPAGARLTISVAAANRDPARFDDPDALRLDRGAGHLSFGHGPHRCLGAALGRRVGRAAVAALLARGAPLRSAGPLEALAYADPVAAGVPVRLVLA